uniref:Candidate secreted effector n=1 Tax=Meloidogyne incognita TaxID=6306 RepID=A0A914LFF5_MELIC
MKSVSNCENCTINKLTTNWTIVRRERKCLRPSFDISIPSIIILPEAGSTKRNKARTTPVLPTIPIFS